MPADVVLVVAVAGNGVIGHRGGMPWHAPEDLKRFRRITMGHPVIMGRRTFESIGKPLPSRQNIVLTRNAEWRADGVDTAADVTDALAVARGSEALMVIGGAEIFAQWLPFASRVELTRLHISPPGDTFWTPLPEDWRLLASETPDTAMPPMTFETWQRNPVAG